MRNLIPNNVTVSEQFKLLGAFNQAVNNWHMDIYKKPVGQANGNEVVKRLEEDYGIKCVIKNEYAFRVLSPKVVDEKKYMFFMLRYQ